MPFFSELVMREASFSTASSAFSRTLPRALPREAKGLGTQRSHSWRSLGILSERSNSDHSSLLYIWKKFSVIPSLEKKQLYRHVHVLFSPSITEAFTMTSMLIPNHLIYTFISIFSIKVDGISKRNNAENYELFPGNDLQMIYQWWLFHIVSSHEAFFKWPFGDLGNHYPLVICYTLELTEITGKSSNFINKWAMVSIALLNYRISWTYDLSKHTFRITRSVVLWWETTRGALMAACPSTGET